MGPLHTTAGEASAIGLVKEQARQPLKGNDMHSNPKSRRREVRAPLQIAGRVTIIYAVVGALWILFSDRLLALLVSDPDKVTQLQTLKGWVYVGFTALLLAWLIDRYTERLHREQTNVRRLNRTYQFLSGINSAIVRVRASGELAQTACELAVDKGNFTGARIFLRNGRGQPADLAGQAGSSGGWPPAMAAPLVEVMGQADAVEPIWIGRMENAALPAAWHQAAQEQGVSAVAALPIPDWAKNQPARGWLELYGGADQVFDAQEAALLREIAADIGLGLETIDKSNSLQTLAHYDALTGLPNEALLIGRLQQALSRAHHNQRTVAVVVVDCPELTRLVDIRGRHVGDRLRKQLADYLTAALREGDTVARTGQDEFTLVLADMAQSGDMVQLSERLLRGPTVPVDEGAMRLALPLRGGAALYPSDADTAENLIQYAALTLHTAATAPGSCMFYSASLNALTRSQLRLEHELQHAIERDELSLVYQLVADTETRRPIGAEALLRWHSGALGNIGPGQFIPIAEANGLIHPLGRWVLERSCHQIATWRAAGLRDFSVSVNVAAPQLLRDGFIDELRRILDRTGLCDGAPGLAIEITETAIMRDLGRAVAVLQQIRDLGIRLYLDDFGTGYSSLSYLSQLPIDVLKIDYGFTSKLPHDQRTVSLVKAIIVLAHSLDVSVIAEGVETAEQSELLRQLGCDAIQGYLIGRPVPADQLQAAPAGVVL